MEPFDLIWWALAFLIASIPITIGIAIIGMTVVELANKYRGIK